MYTISIVRTPQTLLLARMRCTHSLALFNVCGRHGHRVAVDHMSQAEHRPCYSTDLDEVHHARMQEKTQFTAWRLGSNYWDHK